MQGESTVGFFLQVLVTEPSSRALRTANKKVSTKESETKQVLGSATGEEVESQYRCWEELQDSLGGIIRDSEVAEKLCTVGGKWQASTQWCGYG